MSKAKIGIVTIGHAPYWPQFPGLKEELMAKTRPFIDMIIPYSEVCDAGFVDTISASWEAVRKLKKMDVDGIFLLLSTYVTSSLAAPFAMYFDVPIILAALQPENRLDYKHTTTHMELYNDDICALPEISGVMKRLNHEAADVIVGSMTDDDAVKEQIRQWCMALNAVAAFKYSSIGYLGHTYEGMYDMHTDATAFSRTFKSHVEMLEMCELAELYHQVSDIQLNEKINEIKQKFKFASHSYDPLTAEILPEDINLAAKVSAALEMLVENHNLTGLAYYYKGENNNLYQLIGSNMIIGNSFLTSRGIPLAGEADLKTCAAMLIMDRIGAGGSFAELHPCDFIDDIILIGHDGPHNIKISDDVPILRKLSKFHGKAGSGVSVEFSIKAGALSLLSIGIDEKGQFIFVNAEGESIKGNIPATGNTNTRCRFKMGVHDFVRRWCLAGSTHHLALGIGHHGDVIEKVSKILKVSNIRIE